MTEHQKTPRGGVSPGRPRRRDLGGAFFCGEGVHDYVKPNGHRMDDLWFYDVNGHRWICLYPGANTKTCRLKLDADGFEVNDKGEHIPVAYLGHAYGSLTYMPDLRKFVVIYAHVPWWTRGLPQRWEWLDQSDPSVRKRYYGHVGPVIRNAKHPLFWDVATGSAAEDLTVLLHGNGRATVVGEPTAGSTGQPIFFGLPGGGRVRICTGQARYPDGREFVGPGIQPGVPVKRTVKAVVEGRDEVLEAALKLIRSRQRG